MNGFDALSVLRDLERADTWVDIIDAVRLVEVAGFVLDGQQGNHRIYRHPATGEWIELRVNFDIPPGYGPAIADRVKNYWP